MAITSPNQHSRYVPSPNQSKPLVQVVKWVGCPLESHTANSVHTDNVRESLFDEEGEMQPSVELHRLSAFQIADDGTYTTAYSSVKLARRTPDSHPSISWTG